MYALAAFLFSYVLPLLAVPTCIYLLCYAFSNLYMSLLGPQNLKKRYQAEWALVTGAGTGIGKSLAETLAGQGLNLVLVSLPDKFLDETVEQLKKSFPSQEFRKVAAKFDHKTDYMPSIIEATKDIHISVLFNNAGYIVTGFFDKSNLDAQLANLECNATACVKLTHHFLQRMILAKRRGCIVFTSSVAGFIPSPFTVMYGATKAFVSQFAASLAAEVRSLGIDVLAVHPSPVNSNFYDKVDAISMLEAAKSGAATPGSIPALMLACIGRSHVADMGSLALTVRACIAMLPYDTLASLFSAGAHLLPDYQKFNSLRGVTPDPVKKAN